MAKDVTIEGLPEAIRALKRFDRQAGNDAVKVLRKGAGKIRDASRIKMRSRPGGGTYPRRSGMVTSRANPKGGKVTLQVEKYPWAQAAELGTRRAWLWGRITTQGTLRRRQFPVYRGWFTSPGVTKAGPGWWLQPTIRRLLPDIIETTGEELNDLLRESMQRAGVRTHG